MILTHVERAERRKAIAEYAVQYGEAATAKKFDVTCWTVRKAAFENGHQLPDRRHGKRERSTSSFGILFALLQGEALVDIAERFGVSKQRVHQIKVLGVAAGFVIKKRRAK